jgi:hypothetical protein
MGVLEHLPSKLKALSSNPSTPTTPPKRKQTRKEKALEKNWSAELGISSAKAQSTKTSTRAGEGSQTPIPALPPTPQNKGRRPDVSTLPLVIKSLINRQLSAFKQNKTLQKNIRAQ